MSIYFLFKDLGLKDIGTDNTTKLVFADGEVKVSAVARICSPITANLDGKNWCLNFPVVHATSDLGLILVNHAVILTTDCLLTSSSAKRFYSQAYGKSVQCFTDGQG